MVLAGLVLLLVLAAAAGVYAVRRPQVYDGVGQMFYTRNGVDYQILVAWPNNRCEPAPDIYQSGKADEPGRWPSRLYVNHRDTGADAWEQFQELVDQVTVEVVQDPEGASDLTATQPSHDDYSPDAAMVSYLDFAGDCGCPQVVWTVRMKNGDVIRVRQNILVTLIHTLVYDWHDYPMDTLDQLQDLVDRLAEETYYMDEVKLYLPPVTYEGKLELTGRSFELHGCTGAEGRTVFTDTVQVATEHMYWINYFYDIDFAGSADGVGISASVKCWAENCTFTGWKTAVLGYGTAWVNVIGCTFTDNQVGFHFNSTGQSATHSLYNDNVFRRNSTAVLLENVPTDMVISFEGSVFEDNGTDLDNRCDHPVDVSQAVFQ